MLLTRGIERLFEYPVQEIAKHLPPANAPLWDVDANRQKFYAHHSATRSIVFEWLDNAWTAGAPVDVQTFDYTPQELREPVYAFARALTQHFRGGKVVKLMLADLPAGAKIKPHRDVAEALLAVHRCHLPIVTNKDVVFYADNEPPLYLAPGTAYELNNARAHAVDNNSTQNRVHLICDIMPD